MYFLATMLQMLNDHPAAVELLSECETRATASNLFDLQRNSIAAMANYSLT